MNVDRDLKTSKHLSPALARRHSRFRLTILVLSLPFFGEVFHLSMDIPAFYFLSKAWSFLLLPVAILGYLAIALPARFLVAITFTYTFSIAPLMAIFNLNTSFFEALLATGKIAPLTTYFSLSFILQWLRPTADELRRVLAWLGYASFGVMWLLWVTVPHYVYNNQAGAKTIFIGGDDVRGDRILMPLVFGVLLLFMQARLFTRDGRLIRLLLIGLGVGLMSTIFKERVPIACVIVTIIVVLLEKPFGSRLMALCVSGTFGVAILSIGLAFTGLAIIGEKFGGSFIVRSHTFMQALDFISTEPSKWVFGFGGSSSFAVNSLEKMFRNPLFYLADIGWLGVIFEYGVIGALLLLGCYLSGMYHTRKLASSGDSLGLSMADYAWYLPLTTVIYSATLLPGELGLVCALGFYLHQLRSTESKERALNLLRTPTMGRSIKI